ncbi:30S ribosomal protein S3 [Patescibacteria group bacterium]|nr:30S ribosomal protein S3 [Patescibacteria group bacterium]MBU1890337.1 30S ribosomal protein S3 [Patescibacteria group bacterium]
MGHKVDPRSFRLKQITTWKSKWFARKNFSGYLKTDDLIRSFLLKKLKDAGVATVEIERSAKAIEVIVKTSRPGVVIGRGGAGIEDLKKILKDKFLASDQVLNVKIQEVTKPYLNAELVVRMMAEQIEKRMPFRRVIKQAVLQVERAGAKGVKVSVAGRLNGAEIARTEKLNSGSIPLHTIRADIDYAQGVAHTTYGAIGVKAWIYKGEVFKKDSKSTQDN